MRRNPRHVYCQSSLDAAPIVWHSEDEKAGSAGLGGLAVSRAGAASGTAQPGIHTQGKGSVSQHWAALPHLGCHMEYQAVRRRGADPRRSRERHKACTPSQILK